MGFSTFLHRPRRAGDVPRRALPPLLLALLAAAALVPAAQDAHAAKKKAPAASGKWVTVSERLQQSSFPAVGSFRARQAARLGVQVSGRVQQVMVDVGDLVKGGQELLKLDPEFFRIEVTQRTAELDAARATAQEAELNFNRMKSLFEKPAGETPSIARKLYDDANTAYLAASARLRGAEGALQYSQKRLDETLVRAPFNAVVTKRMVDPGEPVNSAPITYVLEVQEVEQLDLEFSLPQDMLSRVQKGTPLTYEVDGVTNGKGRATIGVIYPSLDEATRSFRCRATVPNPGLRIKPGMLAQVSVLEGTGTSALTVPRKALTQTADGWQVRINDGGKAVSRNVKVGALSDEHAEVQEGLKPGDRVWVPSRS
jgi:membrane fusion protein (multidrug efflux system)